MVGQDKTNEHETWRSVPAIYGRYEVSTLGRCRNATGRVMRPGSGKGYPQYVLYCSGHGRTVAAHRLVLEAFIGQRPPGLECRHLDGNRNNPALSNLAWGTPRENHLDSVAHGTCQLRRGNPGANRRRKLLAAEVLDIRAAHERGTAVPTLLKLYPKVKAAQMYRIVRRQQWKWV